MLLGLTFLWIFEIGYDIISQEQHEFDEVSKYMDGKTTIKYLQTYIIEKDYHLELLKDYSLKLTEEVGELV